MGKPLHSKTWRSPLIHFARTAWIQVRTGTERPMEHTSETRLLCTPRGNLLPEFSETTRKKPEVLLDTGAGATPPKGMCSGYPPADRDVRERIR